MPAFANKKRCHPKFYQGINKLRLLEVVLQAVLQECSCFWCAAAGESTRALCKVKNEYNYTMYAGNQNATSSIYSKSIKECSELWAYLSYGQSLVPWCPDKGGLSVYPKLCCNHVVAIPSTIIYSCTYTYLLY